MDTYESFVWEPSLVKTNAITAATEAACLVSSQHEYQQARELPFMIVVCFQCLHAPAAKGSTCMYGMPGSLHATRFGPVM